MNRNRTLLLAVAEVLEGGNRNEFYDDLRCSLELARRAANLCMSECLKQDDIESEKCARLYTYRRAADILPGSACVAANIARGVESQYKKQRWGIRSGRSSVVLYKTFSWPLLHNKSYKTLRFEDRGEYVVARIRLYRGWWTVRLAGGVGGRRQVSELQQAIKSNCCGDSRISVGNRGCATLRVSLSRPLPLEARGHGVMYVSSGISDLLIATVCGEKSPLIIGASVPKQWKLEADSKQRLIRVDCRRWADSRDRLRAIAAVSSKLSRRNMTLAHEASAAIVNKARKFRVAKIVLDTSVRSSASWFPWSSLIEKIKYKAEDANVEVELVVPAAYQQVASVSEPHVYFILDRHAGRVKIGRTGSGKDRLRQYRSFCPDALLLAIDTTPGDLAVREQHWLSCLSAYRVIEGKGSGMEVFSAQPVIDWLAKCQMLGNSGNLEEIRQNIDISVYDGHLQANDKHLSVNGCGLV